MFFFKAHGSGSTGKNPWATHMLLGQVLGRPNQEKEAVVAPGEEPSVIAGEGRAWVCLNTVPSRLYIPPCRYCLFIRGCQRSSEIVHIRTRPQAHSPTMHTWFCHRSKISPLPSVLSGKTKPLRAPKSEGRSEDNDSSNV